MTLLPDSSQIRELFVLSRHTGQCLYHSRGKHSASLDEGIFSAFIAAIFNFSEELGSDQLEQLRMGEKEILLEKKGDFIFVLEAEEVKQTYLMELLMRISQEFTNTVNDNELDPSKLAFQTNLLSTGFEERLFEIFKQVSTKLLIESPQERFEKVTKTLSSILGKSLAGKVLEEIKSSSNVKKIENEESLEKLFEELEVSLTKRINKAQAKQLVKKLRNDR
ncbi:MAG: hypothetical protein ACXAEU_13605 [Candidatus Hodarchaeales archaeon]